MPEPSSDSPSNPEESVLPVKAVRPLADLFKSFYRSLHRALIKRFRDRVAVAEALEDTWLELQGYVGPPEPERGVAAWFRLYRIAELHCRDAKKQKRKGPATLSPNRLDRLPARVPDIERPAERAERAQRVSRLRQKVRELPKPQRTVIELLHFSGLSASQCADSLGISVEAVSIHQAEGLKTLRASLKEFAGVRLTPAATDGRSVSLAQPSPDASAATVARPTATVPLDLKLVGDFSVKEVDLLLDMLAAAARAAGGGGQVVVHPPAAAPDRRATGGPRP